MDDSFVNATLSYATYSYSKDTRDFTILAGTAKGAGSGGGVMINLSAISHTEIRIVKTVGPTSWSLQLSNQYSVGANLVPSGRADYPCYGIGSGSTSQAGLLPIGTTVLTTATDSFLYVYTASAVGGANPTHRLSMFVK